MENHLDHAASQMSCKIKTSDHTLKQYYWNKY